MPLAAGCSFKAVDRDPPAHTKPAQHTPLLAGHQRPVMPPLPFFLQVAVVSVADTATYWATGKDGRLLAVDPRAPAIITKFVAPQNCLGRHCVEEIISPPGTELVLAATKGRHVVVWQYNQHGAHR